MEKKVIITGCTGQDGSYMAEYLLKNTDNIVIAGVRRTSQAILSNLSSVVNNPRFRIVTVDLCDAEAVRSLVRDEKPDYLINLGAQTFVKDSWKNPVAHMTTNAISLIYILEAIREYTPWCRFYSAGSSEQWGDVKYSPQDMNHPNSPRSIYGVSKCAAQGIVKVYRESYGLYAVHGLLLNHESERRQEYFVTRKITKGVARIVKAIKSVTKDGVIVGECTFDPIKLGNIDSKRDWSHAEDFVDGIWKMLNQENYRTEKLIPDIAVGSVRYKFLVDNLREYVLASGEMHSVREFVEQAFKVAGYEGIWKGEGQDAVFRIYCGQTKLQWSNGSVEDAPVFGDVVFVDPEYYRPADVVELCGDSSPARKELGWEPKVTFHELVNRMVKYDLENE